MRRMNSDVSSTQPAQARIGMRVPKHLRIGSFTHPGGLALPDGGRIPCLMLRGMWLDGLDLRVGSRVVVTVEPKRITLMLDETPIPVPYRHLDHPPKKKRRLARPADNKAHR